MGRTAPFVVAPKSYPSLPLDTGDFGEELRMDKVMSDLALAFARDLEIADSEPVGEKWPAAWTLAFVVTSSVVLWVLIAVLVAAIL